MTSIFNHRNEVVALRKPSRYRVERPLSVPDSPGTFPKRNPDRNSVHRARDVKLVDHAKTRYDSPLNQRDRVRRRFQFTAQFSQLPSGGPATEIKGCKKIEGERK